MSRGASSTPSSSPPSGSALDASAANAVTALHNGYRALHVGTAALSWDDGIAATAQAWADNCVFEHSVRLLSAPRVRP